MISENQGNPIRPLTRGAVVVQGISPVRSSNGMKIVLYKCWRVSIHHPLPESRSLQNKDDEVVRGDCEEDPFLQCIGWGVRTDDEGRCGYR